MPAHPRRSTTANDHFKGEFGTRVWRSIALAAAMHFGVFALWPTLSAADVSYDDRPAEVVTLPEVTLPEPPPDIPRPALPVPTPGIEDVQTSPPTSFDAWSVDDLPPPPTRGEGVDKFEIFVPSMVPPRVLNAPEVARALQDRYPPLLRDAGIGGTVDVLLWIDEQGTVVRARVARSSGHPSLDQAALEVVEVMRLSPALNRDRAVPVKVTLPVRFHAR